MKGDTEKESEVWKEDRLYAYEIEEKLEDENRKKFNDMFYEVFKGE